MRKHRGPHEQDNGRATLVCRFAKSEEGCELTKHSEERRLEGSTVRFKEYERLREDIGNQGFSCTEKIQPKAKGVEEKLALGFVLSRQQVHGASVIKRVKNIEQRLQGSWQEAGQPKVFFFF